MGETNFIKVILSALTGLGAYLCGLNWEIIFIWVILMIIDIISGVIKAAKNRSFASHDMKIGLLKKIGEFLLLFALVLIQRVAIINGINVPVATIFVGAFCFKEVGSIVENSVGVGIKVPNIIQKWLKVANEAINNYGNDDGGDNLDA